MPFKTPKGCHVRSVHLDGTKRQAEISYSCGGGFDGRSDYRHVNVRGVVSVSTPGATISGNARVGFVLMPDHVTCRKNNATLHCSVVREGQTLSGARRKRKRQ